MDSAPRPSRLMRLARALISGASVIVPRWRRGDWRREWDAELWYETRDPLRRSAGAIPHAVRLLQQHWSLDMLSQDIRYGCRMLRRNPGFAVVAATTLALGIGANTAIFSIVNAVLWRELPYAQSSRLVQLWETNPDRNWTDAECAPANFDDWRRTNSSFEAMAAYWGAAREPWLMTYTLNGFGEPERLKGLIVTANFFSVLGVPSAYGRTFTPQEEWKGADDVVMLSHGAWNRRFGSDTSIVGKPILLDGRARTVVGILPADFTFGARAIDVFVPMGWTPEQIARQRRPHNLRAVARLKPNVTLEQAQSELQAIARDLERRYPDTNTHMGVGVGLLREWVVGPSRAALLMFLGAVALVLLVACANVANLMLARGASRDREIGVRAALGASGTRLSRQMLTESLLLAAIGGALGLFVAYAAVRGVVAYSPAGLPRLDEIRIDRVALAFTTLVTVLTGVVFGLVPARQSRVQDLTATLRGSARHDGVATGSSALRRGLVVAELALSVALLVGASLLIRSFVKLNQVDLGFVPEHAVTMQIALSRTAYPQQPQHRAFVDRLLERARALPGVTAAGASQRAVLEGFLWTSDFSVEHRGPDDFGIQVRHNELSPGYLDAIGARLVRGRDFTAADTAGAPLVVLVNDVLVRRYFGDRHPIGQRLNFDRPGGTGPWRTIVGVVHSYREEVVGREPNPTIYESLSQNTDLLFTLVVRSTLDATAITPSLRAIVRELDANVPVGVVSPLEDRVAEAVAPERFTTVLMGVFAATGLLLASVGLYGVLSYLAGRRTHEIGVRIALGAGGGDVVRLVGGQAFVLVAIGIGVGCALAMAAGRLMTGLLFGVAPTDPATYAIVIGVIAAVAAIAVLMPVRRAMRVNPVVALRAE